jgi:hypothetical protein
MGAGVQDVAKDAQGNNEQDEPDRSGGFHFSSVAGRARGGATSSWLLRNYPSLPTKLA